MSEDSVYLHWSTRIYQHDAEVGQKYFPGYLSTTISTFKLVSFVYLGSVYTLYYTLTTTPKIHLSSSIASSSSPPLPSTWRKSSYIIMKEAIVKKDISVDIVDSPIPKPGPDHVLIKVIIAGRYCSNITTINLLPQGNSSRYEQFPCITMAIAWSTANIKHQKVPTQKTGNCPTYALPIRTPATISPAPWKP